jgi:hypothetical protein
MAGWIPGKGERSRDLLERLLRQHNERPEYSHRLYVSTPECWRERIRKEILADAGAVMADLATRSEPVAALHELLMAKVVDMWTKDYDSLSGLITMTEAWAWRRSEEGLVDRQASPWDDPNRRPSHADKRRAWRRELLAEEIRAVLRPGGHRRRNAGRRRAPTQLGRIRVKRIAESTAKAKAQALPRPWEAAQTIAERPLIPMSILGLHSSGCRIRALQSSARRPIV